MCTVHDFEYDTFHEAAVELGVFSNENEGYYALQEVVSSLHTPGRLRFLFSRIILEGYPAVPLWDSFCDQLTLDWHEQTDSEEGAIDKVLYIISLHLEDSGQGLQDFGLPEPENRSVEIVFELAAFSRHTEELSASVREMYKTLRPQQLLLFQSLLDPILSFNPTSHNPSTMAPQFIEGKPGHGKMYLIRCLSTAVWAQGCICLVVGTTALAASLYE